MTTTADAVKSWLKLTTTTPQDDTNLTACVTTANSLAARYASGVTTADLALGATMLAARLYRRRNSPEGTQVVAGDNGTQAVTIARTDPDIARLWRIDAMAIPQVG